MPYISNGELLNPRAAERAQRKALLYTWSLAVAFLVGAPGAYFLVNTFEASYTAEGSLWIASPSRPNVNDSGAMKVGSLLNSDGWIGLLRSRSVLDPVVVDHQLFVQPPEEQTHAFASFNVAEQFVPGDYELRIGDRGEDFVLFDGQGAVVQRGTVGSPIGLNMGFIWTFSRADFAPGATVEFAVQSHRTAAETLAENLVVAMDREGNFLSVGLNGTNPKKVADVLNAVLERCVELADELKKTKLVELQAVLEGQLQEVQLEMEQAERDLEEFRIGASRASSDQPLPVAERMVEEERLNRRFEVSASLFSDLQARLETARSAAASSIPDIRILDRASVPTRPRKGSRFPIAVVFFLGCLAAALSGALVLNRMAAAKAAET